MSPPSLFSQTKDNELIKTTMRIHNGVCLHNGIVYKDLDEWTVDACTECTCQVSTSFSPTANISP